MSLLRCISNIIVTISKNIRDSIRRPGSLDGWIMQQPQRGQRIPHHILKIALWFPQSNRQQAQQLLCEPLHLTVQLLQPCSLRRGELLGRRPDIGLGEIDLGAGVVNGRHRAGRTDLETFFEVVVLAGLRGKVAAVGVGVGATEGLFGDGEFCFLWQGKEGGREGEDLCVREAERRVDQVGEAGCGEGGGEGAGEGQAEGCDGFRVRVRGGKRREIDDGEGRRRRMRGVVGGRGFR